MSDKKLSLPADEIVNRMTDAYSGYRFTPSTDITVVNPEACIYYLRAGDYHEREATPVKPRSIRTSADVMDAMFNLGDTTDTSKIVLSAVQGRPLPTPATLTPLGSDSRRQLTNDEQLDLLRCMGFLTYSETASEFVVPNKYMAEGIDLYFLKRIAGFGSFIIGDFRAKEVVESLTQGDIRPFFKRITEPLKETGNASRSYSDEFILRTAARVLVNLCTDYHLETCGNSGFRLIPITENAPTYWVEMATVKAGEKTTDAVSRQLADTEEKLKPAASFHPFNGSKHLVKVAAVFSDFELVAMESC